MGFLALTLSGHLNAAGFKGGGSFPTFPGCQTSRAAKAAKPKVQTVASTRIARENRPTTINPMSTSRTAVILPPVAGNNIEARANTFVSAVFPDL